MMVMSRRNLTSNYTIHNFRNCVLSSTEILYSEQALQNFESPTITISTTSRFSFPAKHRTTLEIAFLYLYVRHAVRMNTA